MPTGPKGTTRDLVIQVLTRQSDIEGRITTLSGDIKDRLDKQEKEDKLLHHRINTTDKEISTVQSSLVAKITNIKFLNAGISAISGMVGGFMAFFSTGGNK